MKKFNCILTKNGDVYIFKKHQHEELIIKYKIKGKEWKDWVRLIVSYQKQKWIPRVKIHFNENYPEWLERQYGYFMDKIMEESMRLGLI